MPKYGEFYYGSGEVYGDSPRLSFSVEPFTAEATWYDRVELYWQSPVASAGESYNGFRIVRNQFAYPETPDDGIVLLDWPSETTTSNPAGLLHLTDTVNLVSGKFAFYRIWLKRASDAVWLPAGDAETLIPSEHSSILGPSYIDNDGIKKSINQVVSTTHDKLMGYLPKIFTTGTSATSSYDASSALSKFLEGFSFTIDEFLTYTELIVPGTSGTYTNESILKLQSHQFGLSLDASGLSRTQKKLVRNAVYLYSKKGTAVGIKGFAESATGYPVTVSATSNLMLSLQDATFYKGTGNWTTGNLATIVADNTVAPSSAGADDLTLDSTWTAKVTNTASSYGVIRVGSNNPINTGIPVVAGTTYYLSFYIKSASASPSVFGMDINWYDEFGKQIADPHTNTGGSVTSSWSKLSYNRAAPSGAKFAAISITFGNTAATYYVDKVQFAASNLSTYNEPRAAYIYVNPSKYNYVLNPTFVSGGASWTVNNATQTTPATTLDLAPSGSTMLQLVSTGTSTVSSPYLAFSSTTGLFDSGEFYTFSIYAKASTDRTLTIDFYATDTTVGGPGTLEFKSTISVGTSWQRYSVTMYMPETFAKANTNLFVKIYGGSSTATTYYLDCAQIEKGSKATDYFDGSMISMGAGWTTGIANQNNSTSFIYSNRDVKISRLNSEIPYFVPINTGYFIKSLLALESSGITT